MTASGTDTATRKQQLEELQKTYDSIHIPTMDRLMKRTGSWFLFAGLFILIAFLVITFILSMLPNQGSNIYESLFGPEATVIVLVVVEWIKTFSMLLCAMGIWRIISLRSKLLDYGDLMTEVSNVLKSEIDRQKAEMAPVQPSGVPTDGNNLDHTSLK